MVGKDELADVFDDGELKRSIESAEGHGQWRDADAKFVDPKLEALAERLARAPRTTYTERRLEELERRLAAKAKPKRAAPPPPPEFGGPAPEFRAEGEDWRGALSPLPTPPLSAVTGPIQVIGPPAPAGLPIKDWLLTCSAAAVVFAVAASAHGVIAGFTTYLWMRAATAAVITAIAWCWFGGGRFSSAAIGVGAHFLAFLATSHSDDGTEMFGTFLGMLLVLLGSGAVGLSREGLEAPHQG
jgi:hypothetical protein